MIRDRIKELRRVPASQLVANPKNWRKHPKKQRDAMAAVLQEIGYAGALLAREQDGKLVLIDGHLRSEVTPGMDVPVLVLDVTAAEADKILATLDPIAGMAVADVEALRELAGSIDADYADFGALVGDIAGLSAEKEGEDNAQEPPQAPISQPGDLWCLGPHRVLCGDSTVATDVDRLLDGVKPGLMVTDPPYGVNYDPDWRNRADRANGKPYGARAVGLVSNDGRADWRESYSLFPGSIAYIWHAGRYASVVQESIEACGFEIRNQIIWAKSNFAIGRGDYHWQHEPCWYAVKDKGNWTGDRSQTTLWKIAKPQKSETGHSTQKPVECMRRPIVNHTNPGQAVYDPFLGSGTTLIAAETTGRVCYGMELDPAYVDVIVRRWNEFTGKQATCNGKTIDEMAQVTA